MKLKGIVEITVGHDDSIVLEPTEYDGPPSLWLEAKPRYSEGTLLVLRRRDVAVLHDTLGQWLERNP